MNTANDKKKSDIPLLNQTQLKVEFEQFNEIRNSIVDDLKDQTVNFLSGFDSPVAVNGRIKSFASYYSKYLRFYKQGHTTPLITDLLGLRIICPFIQDIKAIEKLIYKNFDVMENEKKGHYTYNEFGYESTHLLINIPKELLDKHGFPGTYIAEIQIRTILQDAWAEVEHELVYKAEFNPVDSVKRKLAAVNASLSLADIIFKEIREYQSTYKTQMGTRRKSFYQKVEEATDNLLFNPDAESFPDTAEVSQDYSQPLSFPDDRSGENPSFDDLLVNALIAHNQNRFDEAISQYTRILKLKLDNITGSVIYKHRGMAKFACSRYAEAIEDFTVALETDPKSYKAAYYRGIVNSVIKEYSKAIDDFTLSLSIYPIQGYCLFRRAQAYFHIGDYPGALADCENSIAVEPSNEAALKFKELLVEKINSMFIG